ncbi:hypothetical protein QL285_054266 [Trifolium repens]|nr:hypothetical protein QL285_054266 [Trifolium repens]
MKVFLWRAARGCLSTRQWLQQKGVHCPHTCAHCQQNFENEWHIFFGCEKAQEIWEEAGLWYLIEGMFETADGFVSLFFKLLDLLSQHLVFQFVSALWCIWKRRNQKIWEDMELQPSVSFQLARDVILQWQTAQTKKQEQNSAATIASHVVTAAARRTLGDDNPATTTTTHVVWRPPGQGMYKCNVDAAIFKEQNCYGAGMCIRDDKGNFIRAQTLWSYGNPLPHEAEAWGLKAAIFWLRNLGYSSVVIELDCKLVVDGITGKLNFRTEFGMLLYACKASLFALSNFRISFIRRQANNVAHLLARAALSFASRQEFDYIPSCIEVTLMNEMN